MTERNLGPKNPVNLDALLDEVDEVATDSGSGPNQPETPLADLDALLDEVDEVATDSGSGPNQPETPSNGAQESQKSHRRQRATEKASQVWEQVTSWRPFKKEQSAPQSESSPIDQASNAAQELGQELEKAGITDRITNWLKDPTHKVFLLSSAVGVAIGCSYPEISISLGGAGRLGLVLATLAESGTAIVSGSLWYLADAGEKIIQGNEEKAVRYIRANTVIKNLAVKLANANIHKPLKYVAAITGGLAAGSLGGAGIRMFADHVVHPAIIQLTSPHTPTPESSQATATVQQQTPTPKASVTPQAPTTEATQTATAQATVTHHATTPVPKPTETTTPTPTPTHQPTQSPTPTALKPTEPPSPTPPHATPTHQPTKAVTPQPTVESVTPTPIPTLSPDQIQSVFYRISSVPFDHIEVVDQGHTHQINIDTTGDGVTNFRVDFDPTTDKVHLLQLNHGQPVAESVVNQGDLSPTDFQQLHDIIKAHQQSTPGFSPEIHSWFNQHGFSPDHMHAHIETSNGAHLAIGHDGVIHYVDGTRNMIWRLGHWFNQLKLPEMKDQLLAHIQTNDLTSVTDSTLKVAEVAWGKNMLNPHQYPELYKVLHVMNQTYGFENQTFSAEEMIKAVAEAQKLAEQMSTDLPDSITQPLSSASVTF